MKYIIEKKLKPEIFTDNCEYFFSFMTGRFDYANKLWMKELSTKFNKQFKPINILSAKENKLFKKENYIILNDYIKTEKYFNNKLFTYTLLSEKINELFSNSKYIKKIIKKLLKKQDKVFILPFTTSNLKINLKNTFILGPNSKISEYYDNKINQIKLFDKYNILNNTAKIIHSIKKIEKEKYPYFIYSAHGCGGLGSKKIFFKSDLKQFFSELNTKQKKGPFAITKLIQGKLISPNTTALVTNNNTIVISISDQILIENKYVGNIYPSKLNLRVKNEIIKNTKIIGNHLKNIGFRGLFGLDFIIDEKNKVYTVDLNSRRQGGYLCNVLMAKSKGINIIDLELKTILNENIKNYDYNDFQVNYVWAHKALVGNYDIIKNNYKKNTIQTPFYKLNTNFKCIYYPKNNLFHWGCVGYCVLSGTNYGKVYQKLIKESNKQQVQDLTKHSIFIK